MTEFVEVADRVWVARYDWVDVNVTAVGGERGLVVVDTHGSTAAGRRVVEDLGRLGAGEVNAVVNTHWHWDHCFGNAAFRERDPVVPIHAHEDAVRMLAEQGGPAKARYAGFDDAHAEEVAETELVLPDHTFSSTRSLDLGDRVVELVFPGRGHTDGDLVVVVPDAALVVGGDLVEEAAKPSIGLDSFPLEWHLTLDVVLSLLAPQALLVPGHGAPVGRAFVETQRDELAVIGETVRRLAADGVPLEDAVARGEWPWEPDESIANACRRGYAELPTPGRRLPLV